MSASTATRLVGRERDLEALAALFDDAAGARVVTVLGPGGVGKTRLALALCQRIAVRFSGGTRVVALAQARSAEACCAEVARALGAPLLSARALDDAAAQVGGALAGVGDALVLLDNVEHLTDAVAPLCERWMREAPRVRWLLTSRERLRVYDEQVYELEPLATEPGEGGAHGAAVELFLERARAVNPKWAVDGAALEDVAALVRGLDGIPLAIELAAARSTVLSAAQLRARLRDRFTLLSSGPRGREARQSTLRAAIDWSWNLLTLDEQRALAECAVFHGGFDLDAAEQVLRHEGAPEPLDLLQALRDKSLLRTDPEAMGRFALYESVRAYADEQLEARGADARAAAQLRHAGHYLSLGANAAQACAGPGALAALAVLVREQDNLRAVYERGLAEAGSAGLARALAALLALDALWSARGPTSARIAGLEAALARVAVTPVDVGLHARAVLALATARKALGDWALVEALCTEAIALAQRAADGSTEGRARGHRATSRAARGMGPQAEEDFDQAIALLAACGDAHGEATVHGNRGVYDSWLGRSDRALASLRRALEAHRALGDRHSEGIHLGRLAILHLELERRSEARALCLEALAILEAVGDVRFAAGVCTVLGVLHHEDGALDEALACAERSTAMQQRAGDRYSEATARYYGARVLHEKGERALARQAYRAALLLFEARGDGRNVALLRAALAALDADEGRFDEARRGHEAAVALARESNDALRCTCVEAYGGLVALARAEALLRGGDTEGATREAALARGCEQALERVAAESEDARFVLRLLRRARAQRAEPEETLRAARDGSFFEAPGGARVDLAKRAALRGVFAALLEARARDRAAVLDREALIAAGWPGEKMRADAAMNRLYVALNTLRKLGLGAVLESVDAGWRLRPDAPVLVVDGPAAGAKRS